MSSGVGIETVSFAGVPSWRTLLQDATTESQVVSCVRDHLALWTPEEIARLPEECRPGRIKDAEDVSRWAFALATHHCASNLQGEEEHQLTKMLVFVTQAAHRIAELQAVRETSEPS
jgi:hypothetical protein